MFVRLCDEQRGLALLFPPWYISSNPDESCIESYIASFMHQISPALHDYVRAWGSRPIPWRRRYILELPSECGSRRGTLAVYTRSHLLLYDSTARDFIQSEDSQVVSFQARTQIPFVEADPSLFYEENIYVERNEWQRYAGSGWKNEAV